MTELKNTTKKAAAIIADSHKAGHRSIYEAYGRPSAKKVSAAASIEARAKRTPGYNNDFRIISAGTSFFSTIYTYMENGRRVIIKDTPSETYKVVEA